MHSYNKSKEKENRTSHYRLRPLLAARNGYNLFTYLFVQDNDNNECDTLVLMLMLSVNNVKSMHIQRRPGTLRH